MFFCSFAVSVKMNILLFAPGLLFILLYSIGMYSTFICISVCAVVQVWIFINVCSVESLFVMNLFLMLIDILITYPAISLDHANVEKLAFPTISEGMILFFLGRNVSCSLLKQWNMHWIISIWLQFLIVDGCSCPLDCCISIKFIDSFSHSYFSLEKRMLFFKL